MSLQAKPNLRRGAGLKTYLYIAPAVLFVFCFCILSILFTLVISFTNWSGLGDFEFVGFSNYIAVFQDKNFLLSCINTLVWVAAGLIIPVVLPLLFAIAITKSSFSTLFKNLFYFPNAVSGVIVGLIMTSLLSMYGLPQLLGMMGFENLDKNWLNIPYVNTGVMIGAGIWQGIGMNMLLFIIGLVNMPTEPIEAAKLEGASGLTLYTKIILPLLKPTIIVVVLMSLVNSFKTFDSIWVMTGGGPYRTSETLAVTMYKESFSNSHLGMGSAIAVMLSVIILVISIFYLRKTFTREGGQ
ncbi:carbohydrate ABC transporter permease [Listeria booriae]|uniref:Sugar ABC transporter permease n=1 Tax=Listeria booriae TaxID=1552123 RepID=A0A7X1CIB1_9LIST|nr:sugar ABC transporter permease [Listeria booriae]MBC1231678.1 sugar ABC transporter permease [Listeria booriae]MBC1316450.1 sugar ABC transporter permease [Listeria booriae]MBC1400745.1 sugar ABC transporter permease [Listeria booriae]MBC1552010.1 sugar ABC transporter permease [Listeria booriae]MBC1558882.1 sugar ABC transporter permease [Listeria booriae]